MKGSCHCRAIQFEVSGEPNWLGACYCVDCRKVSGAPYLSFAWFNQVTFTKGTPKKYQSSEKASRTFCDNCGASIAWISGEHSDKLFLCVGLFDEPEKLAPQKHIFTEQRLP
jgi:hypothetical protein